MNEIPSLTFFCELDSKELQTLFTDSAVLKKLRTLNANVSMGLQDFSAQRAEVVQKLTKAGIPVTAWLLLPKDKGYWTNLDTVAATAKTYGQFKEWVAKYKLSIAVVGLDIEPHYARMVLFPKQWQKLVPDLFWRLFEGKKYTRLEGDLRALVNLIRTDGFAVETYNFPFVVEERLGHSRFLTRLLGTPPLNADREVLMLYSSFFSKQGEAILWSYAQGASSVGLGSTGGGVEVDGENELRSLRWLDLRRDLLIARQFCRHIYIFSLEGSVRNGYLDRLIDFDWNARIDLPVSDGKKVMIARKGLQALLWLLSHPWQILGSFALLFFLQKKKK
ncbi:MAG: hypothetical protein VB013_12580 [Anaerolineaceae bacterium]|nr:hypothetical protein [Anaerolineaceae bacterium]